MEGEVVAAQVEVEAVEAMAEVEMAAATVAEVMVVVVKMVEEVPESITSTLPHHKSTTRLLIHTRTKPTLSPQLQLLPLLWQPLPL